MRTWVEIYTPLGTRPLTMMYLLYNVGAGRVALTSGALCTINTSFVHLTSPPPAPPSRWPITWRPGETWTGVWEGLVGQVEGDGGPAGLNDRLEGI